MRTPPTLTFAAILCSIQVACARSAPPEASATSAVKAEQASTAPAASEEKEILPGTGLWLPAPPSGYDGPYDSSGSGYDRVFFFGYMEGLDLTYPASSPGTMAEVEVEMTRLGYPRVDGADGGSTWWGVWTGQQLELGGYAWVYASARPMGSTHLRCRGKASTEERMAQMRAVCEGLQLP